MADVKCVGFLHDEAKSGTPLKQIAVPPGLSCSFCKDKLVAAVLLPCCQMSMCLECALKMLVRSHNNCNLCSEMGVYPRYLIPNSRAAAMYLSSVKNVKKKVSVSDQNSCKKKEKKIRRVTESNEKTFKEKACIVDLLEIMQNQDKEMMLYTFKTMIDDIGGSLYQRDKSRPTPLDLAIDGGFKKITEALLDLFISMPTNEVDLLNQKCEDVIHDVNSTLSNTEDLPNNSSAESSFNLTNSKCNKHGLVGCIDCLKHPNVPQPQSPILSDATSSSSSQVPAIGVFLLFLVLVRREREKGRKETKNEVEARKAKKQ